MTEYLPELRAQIIDALTPGDLLGTYTFTSGNTPAIKIEGADREEDVETGPIVTGLEVVVEADVDFLATPNHDGMQVERRVRVTLKAWDGNTIAAREALCRLPQLARVGDRVPVSKGLGNIETQTLLFSYPQLINRS